MDKTFTTYGYQGETLRDSTLSIKKGQNFAGYAIGIVTIFQNWYPYAPGNVQNAGSYRYPVLMQAVDSLSNHQLFSGDPSVLGGIVRTAKQLEAQGCRAIIGACGFFGNYQREVAAALDIPVALSSLCQVPWVMNMIPPAKKIGIMSASGDDVTDALLDACGIIDKSRLAVKNLSGLTHFSAVITEDRAHCFEHEKAGAEVVSAAAELLHDNPDIGALVLECSDLPPYAADIQRETGLPVFDFITMADFLYGATHQTPYSGWL